MVKFLKGVVIFLLFTIICSSVNAKDKEFKDEVYKNYEKIRELYENEETLNSEIKSLEMQIMTITDEISLKQTSINEINLSIEDYENKIKDLNNEIEDLNNEISNLEEDISTNINAINEFEEEIKKFNDVINKRLRNLYMHMDSNNVLVRTFYTSENILEFIDKVVNINKFNEADKNIIDKVIKNIEIVKMKNGNIEIYKKTIEDKIKDINFKISGNDENINFLSYQKDLKQKEIEEIVKLNQQLNDQYESLSYEKKLIQDEIIKVHQDNTKLQEEIREYLQKLNEDNKTINSKVNYGKYLRPAKGKITSKYGKRTHPITGKESFHTGVDIAGDIGDDVVASLGGIVASAGWYNSVYGNVVIINHGNNIQTFYAHLSKILVKKGQEIDRGDLIARIGTTGLSTGAHLHFEIRVGGEPVDPLKRIK